METAKSGEGDEGRRIRYYEKKHGRESERDGDLSISSFKASVIGGEGRETTASASNTVPAAKIEIGGDEANPAGFQGKDNSRKRP
ncbi:hypothetical protein F2Q70_00013809 [Brassica cretica]|uniref:Uncharacterized protein n=1 Tax=Brassica cretica TaxID=69181 RepID=A0A8S9MA49_BRACR|nr:hypothetical protein F2Q70_00013809 [Brassica cretica]